MSNLQTPLYFSGRSTTVNRCKPAETYKLARWVVFQACRLGAFERDCGTTWWPSAHEIQYGEIVKHMKHIKQSMNMRVCRFAVSWSCASHITKGFRENGHAQLRKYHQWSNIINYLQISSDIFKYNEISSNILKWYQLSAIIKYHRLSPTNTIYHQLSSNIFNYHRLTSSITNYLQISSKIIKCHQLSSTITNYNQISATIINHLSPTIFKYHQIFANPLRQKGVGRVIRRHSQSKGFRFS